MLQTIWHNYSCSVCKLLDNTIKHYTCLQWGPPCSIHRMSFVDLLFFEKNIFLFCFIFSLFKVYLYVSNCFDELNKVDPIVNKCNALWCYPQLTFLFWVVLEMYCNSPNLLIKFINQSNCSSTIVFPRSHPHTRLVPTLPLTFRSHGLGEPLVVDRRCCIT